MANPKAEVLSKKKREAVGLLSIGTFLEYFDLMLYVHMAVLLNELFFPKTDPNTAKLLAATAFCMTFVLRPVAGYIVGRIGDLLGRKITIIITTSIMAVTCIMMSLMPTYEKAGIVASIGIILCRMLQGFSSLGEAMGASVYLSETLKSPTKYIAGGIVDMSAIIGGFTALGVASFVLYYGFSWRIVFGVGAVIAFIGIAARTRLRESPEFIKYKNCKKMDSYKLDKKKFMGLFFTCETMGFYFSYVYLADFMKTNLSMASQDIIDHNLIFSASQVFVFFGAVYLYKYIHPTKVIKFCIYIFSFTLLIVPYCLQNIVVLGGESFLY